MLSHAVMHSVMITYIQAVTVFRCSLFTEVYWGLWECILRSSTVTPPPTMRSYFLFYTHHLNPSSPRTMENIRNRKIATVLHHQMMMERCKNRDRNIHTKNNPCVLFTKNRQQTEQSVCHKMKKSHVVPPDDTTELPPIDLVRVKSNKSCNKRQPNQNEQDTHHTQQVRV